MLENGTARQLPAQAFGSPRQDGEYEDGARSRNKTEDTVDIDSAASRASEPIAPFQVHLEPGQPSMSKTFSSTSKYTYAATTASRDSSNVVYGTEEDCANLGLDAGVFNSVAPLISARQKTDSSPPLEAFAPEQYSGTEPELLAFVEQQHVLIMGHLRFQHQRLVDTIKENIDRRPPDVEQAATSANAEGYKRSLSKHVQLLSSKPSEKLKKWEKRFFNGQEEWRRDQTSIATTDTSAWNAFVFLDRLEEIFPIWSMLARCRSVFPNCCVTKRRSGRLSAVINGSSPEHVVVHTPKLDGVIGFCIVANAIVMAVNYQWKGYLGAVELGLDDHGAWKHAKVVFDVFEHAFTIIFIIELVLRLWLFGLKYFGELVNLFDVALVVSSIADLYVLQPLGKSGGRNLTFIRLARVFRVMRVLRVFRVMKMFSSLRVLVQTIHSSGRALVWSMVLLGIIMAVCGILICQTLEGFIFDNSIDTGKRKEVYHLYGSPARAMYTMFEATLSGCWPNYARILIEDISAWYAVFFIVYVTVVVFAIIRVITALFLKETLSNANDDAEMMIRDQMTRKKAYLSKLAETFEAFDSTGDGSIAWDQFQQLLANPKVKAYLAVLDLEVHESSTLFDLLDDGDGSITYGEFLDGVLRVKGQARSIDLISVQHQCNAIIKALASMQDSWEEVYGNAIFAGSLDASHATSNYHRNTRMSSL